MVTSGKNNARTLEKPGSKVNAGCALRSQDKTRSIQKGVPTQSIGTIVSQFTALAL
jgi:hypothetical protein